MTSVELYTKGTKVWIPHLEKIWEGAELLENYEPSKKTIKLRKDNKETATLTIKTEKDLPFLRNPKILIGENDLTSLSYLHEPAVLHNLQVRFCQNKYIYTYCGIVLVAINPYNELPIYGIDTIQTYRGQPMGDLDPHIFAVAEDAFTNMEREQRDQSIIVSGESGAGKTVSAKYTMRYFATVGGNASETQIEKKVLASSPIMEAIGNAKTTRNDNSSRFGKFIELQFNKQNSIIGASMRTYLLEKSRVVLQANDERNYHIFYQLCAARKHLPHLYLKSCNEFNYLNQGDCPLVDGINDEVTYEETVTALDLLGFSDSQIVDITKVLAAVLHLGNLVFAKDNEGCKILQNDHLKVLGTLLEINRQELEQWLCVRKIQSMREVILKPMTLEESITSRNALAKHIYAELFNWIVLIINKALESEGVRHKFIGVLDIYGFETFEINSFEQFCINYANEKLQQQFNMHVFKLEQEEYVKEEIEWKMIDFYDNQPCIDLIEAKLGILDLLDEECKMPKGSDASWIEKLNSKCTKYSHFGKARFGTSAFVINHFADKVQYESEGFLEKNRDTINEEQISVIRKSTNDLVKRLFATSEQEKLGSKSNTKLKVVSAKPTLEQSMKANKKTVGSQFRQSLNMLMNTLNATTPHYVRCIKPNDDKTSFDFNPKRTVEQLRACGVLETIRISAAGFPGRWSYVDFFQRYRVLCKFTDINRNDPKRTCRNILEKYLKNEDMYAYGKTKIFFRAGQVAYLEKLRAEKLLRCCIIMQSTVRGFIWRKKYLRIINAVYNLQRYCRGYLARRLADQLRRNKAAITIQRFARGWIKRIHYQRLQKLVVGLQCYGRGYLARIRYMKLKYNAKAITIQRYWRGWLARKDMVKRRRKIVLCQAIIRGFLARRQYKRLRIEARSIEHVKKLNKGLENKIFTLQQKIEDLNKSKSEAQVLQNENTELKKRMTIFKAMEVEIKNLKTLIGQKNEKIRVLEETVKKDMDEKMDLISEQEKYQKEIDAERDHWVKETNKLRQELDKINEVLETSQKGAEEKIKIRLAEEKLLLQRQQDSDTQAYQKLLEEYNSLEAHCENLQELISEQNRLNYSNASRNDLLLKLNNTDDHSDLGYGSVRSNKSSKSAHEKIDSVDWKVDNTTESGASSSDSEKPKLEQLDVALVLKLQRKLSDIEREKIRLQKRLDDLELSPRAESAEKSISDSIKISELELANSNLKSQLIELRNSVLEGTGKEKFLEQFKNVQLQVDAKIEEIIQLKSVLSNQTNNLKSLVNSKGRTGEYINEDGELTLAYETQKTINKQLELELQDEKTQYKNHEKEYKQEIERLREEIEKQQTILSAGLQSTPQSQNEAFMQKEISRLTNENLNLIDTNETLTKTIKELKTKLKELNRLIKELGIDLEQPNGGKIEVMGQMNQIAKHTRSMPSVKKRDKEYMGMFAFKEGEESVITKNLIFGLKPRSALTLLPCLPAYIVFMCIRYIDYIDNEERVRFLLGGYANSVKKVVRKRKEDFETKALWLANTLRLLNVMKQYSGDIQYKATNNDKQNQQSLRNFDLSEYQQLLSDISVVTYNGLVCQINEKIQSLIVPGILEHEEIPGISGGKHIGRRRGNSVADTPTEAEKPTQALLQELSSKHKILTFYGVDNKIITQIFKQVFYFIGASSLNNLLLRKELCHWSKGFQIRHNLSHLEMWPREKQLEERPIQESLQPIVQAAQLLQARKDDDDADSVCEMCTALTPIQICKILNLYTPVDEFESRVTETFIKKVHAKLAKERPGSKSESVLMDINFTFAVRFNYEPSDISLEDIELPEVLNLHMLEKI